MFFTRKVLPETDSLVECPLACVTFKRFTIRMNDFVLLEVVWTLKTFSTDLIKKENEKKEINE